ncbi:hypothetical protein [Cellulomonas bogoriensis]|uniref:Uncharacterized protein n=1 Tax=Cellulomonas bogoriensis 69B4 = DSM 16987 TaxID=1386082 RepID=A0A0A0C0Q2_9CELL|nr:hypothetical protein [Cellulomonas bogoriensis]KGM13761.1 hypothetical protein N869_10180 [Cellulomonas bogoriensis 69B4 = DSM 16987]
MTAGDPDWREQRRLAADEHARALRRSQQAESNHARRLLAEFVAEAGRRGIEPVPLRARGESGTGRYRTGLHGWYLRRNESVAVSTEGDFYVLRVPGGLRARLAGATPEPSDPPLVLGKGARDGESIDLKDALAIVLDAGPR